jgi:UDP-N-acetylmuramyl pentapeptide synthase
MLDCDWSSDVCSSDLCALGPEVTVLVKGSRFMKMERVVRSFVEKKQCS